MDQREIALVNAAKNGDVAAFEELYICYYDKIYALAKLTVKDDFEAEDILQTTFIKAWKNLVALKNSQAFSTWLQRITIHECHSYLRKNQPSPSTDDEGEDGEIMQLETDLMIPEQYAEREDLSARLGKIIDDLSVVQKETILLYYFSEMSIEEIAATMDCSPGTVKSRLYLARRAIKTEIKEIEHKTGEKFYGIAGVALIPFGGLFIRQIKSGGLSADRAAELFRRLSRSLLRAPAGRATARSASGATRHAAHASKAALPLWGKIVAVVVGVGLAAAVVLIVWHTLAGAKSGGAAPTQAPAQAQTEKAAETSAVTEPLTAAETEEPTETATEEMTEEPTEEAQVDEGGIFPMFSDSYLFTSGVGGWESELTINPDGTFSGHYFDMDLGNNSKTLSDFSGHFANAQKINDYTYSFELADIAYEAEPGTEETKTLDNGTEIHYYYTTPAGLDGTKTVYAYTADAPWSEMPDGFVRWVGIIRNGNPTLGCKCLYTVETGCGWIQKNR